MSTVAKKGKRKQGKRKPKCSAPAAPVVTKRLLKYDAKLGCMVEVNRTTGETKPVEDSKNTDWLKPRNTGNRCRNVTLWPMLSTSSTILPSEVPEMQRILKRKGVRTTEFVSVGGAMAAKLTSPQHKAEYARARGLADFDAGFNGAAPLRFDGKVPR